MSGNDVVGLLKLAGAAYLIGSLLYVGFKYADADTDGDGKITEAEFDAAVGDGIMGLLTRPIAWIVCEALQVAKVIEE